MKPESIYENLVLQEGARSIRLFTFNRNEQNELFGSLRVQSLDDQDTEWVALSYTWSSAEPAEDSSTLSAIEIDGRCFKIQQNLYRALHSLLDRKREARLTFEVGSLQRTTQWGTLPEYDCSFSISRWHYFWIDAICIDQENLLERNHQVTLMADIFSGAKLVIGWLTPAPSRFKSPMVDSVQLRDLAHLKVVGADNTAQLMPGPGEPNSSARQGLRAALILNEYWKRMWIVQEVVVCSHIIFLYESLWLPVKYLLEVGGYASKLRILLDDHATYQRKRFGRSETEQELHLLPLMMRYQLQSCSDARDRVYALLGMIPAQHAIRPDYGKSVQELFVNVVHAEARYGFSSNQCIRAISEALQLGEDDLAVWSLQKYFAVMDGRRTERLNRGTVCMGAVRYPQSPNDVAKWLLCARKGRRALTEYVGLYFFHRTGEQMSEMLRQTPVMSGVKSKRIKSFIAKASPHLGNIMSDRNRGSIQSADPVLNDALNFLDRLKITSTVIYDAFLNTMKAFKDDDIDTPGVVKRFSSLCGGNSELISGFNLFLPQGVTLDEEGLPSEILPASVSDPDDEESDGPMIAAGSDEVQSPYLDSEPGLDEDNRNLLSDLGLKHLFSED